MKRSIKNLKRYIAFLAVLIILISIVTTPSYALSQNGRQFGAGILAALLGINITLQSTFAPWQQLVDSVAEPLNTAIEYTWPQTDWEDEILDRSQIQIWDEYVEIDGVKYTDIWLSTDAAQKFRTNAFDFATGYSIASNTNGTYASGYGQWGGVPIYNINGVHRTQNFSLDRKNTWYTIGNSQVALIPNGNPYYGNFSYNNQLQKTSSMGGFDTTNNKVFIRLNNINTTASAVFSNNIYSGGKDTVAIPVNDFVSQPFDFDWVSGTIPAEEVLPQGTGMMIRVPSDTLDDFKEDHPDFVINAPINIDFTLDPDLKVDIDDLFDVLVPILADLDFGDIQFIENHSPSPPIQDTLLPDTWWSQLETKLTQIINAIENFSLQPVIQAIQTIPSTIQTIGGNIINTISNLGDTILQDIEQGPIKVIDKALDKLKSIFLPILANLRSALGIWHYVVEWVNGISAPFTWIFGIIQGGMSFIMVPIYACIAGWIVIMVYKRFGR